MKRQTKKPKTKLKPRKPLFEDNEQIEEQDQARPPSMPKNSKRPEKRITDERPKAPVKDGGAFKHPTAAPTPAHIMTGADFLPDYLAGLKMRQAVAKSRGLVGAATGLPSLDEATG